MLFRLGKETLNLGLIRHVRPDRNGLSIVAFDFSDNTLSGFFTRSVVDDNSGALGG
jgi:hypothetical protein